MESEIFNDMYFQAKLDELRLKNPEILCPDGSIIQRICINGYCSKPSFTCNNGQCPTCIKRHKICPMMPFQELTQKLNDRVGSYREFILKVFEIDNVLIDELQKFKKDMTKKYYHGHVQQKYQKIIEEIYEKKNGQFLSGQKAKQFILAIQKQRKNTKWSTELLIKYQAQIRKVIDKVVNLKKSYFQPFISQIVLNSHILWKESKQKSEFLMESLKFPKKIDLIFRASQHQFRANSFHHKCDNVFDTLTLVKTEFGKIVAGYTHYPWNHARIGYVNDTNCRAFLLSLDLKEKMMPDKNGDKLIYCKPEYGPSFGWGDLMISDGCNKNKDSYANFPTTYHCEGLKAEKNQASFKAFVGVTKGNNFKVQQYEVFKVIYE